MDNEFSSKKSYRKSFIIITFVIIFSTLAIGFFIFLSSIYNSAGSQNTDKYKIKGIKNDSFYVEVYKNNYPKLSYSYVVFDDNKRRIFGDELEYEVKIKVDCIFEDKSLRVYELPTNAIIFYNKEQNDFKSILLDQVQNAEVQRYKELNEFALKKLKEGEWKWIKTFAEYLIKSNDKDIVKVLKRYSNGEFSDEEVQKNSEYSKEYIKTFCSQLLSKYNLK